MFLFQVEAHFSDYEFLLKAKIYNSPDLKNVI